MNKIKYFLFSLLIFCVYTQGMWERLFFLSPIIQIIVDSVIIAFIIFEFKYNKKVPGSGLFFIILALVFLIGQNNDDTFIESLFYFRFVSYTYLIYNQLYWLNISQKQWGSIFKLLIWFTLLQGIGALYNVFFLGERIEAYVGLMSSLGGTTATIFPLLISSLVFVYYLFSNRLDRLELIIMILLLLCVFLVGYSSGKRTIFIIIPFFFVFITIFSLTKIKNRTYLRRKILGIVLFGIMIYPLIIFGMENSTGFNYSLSGKESSVEVLLSSIDYASEYESSIDEYGRTIGRSSTTQSIFEKTLENLKIFFWGSGSNAEKDEKTMNEFNYGYGIVGFTRDLLSFGIFISLLTVLLFYRIVIDNKSFKSKFTKTLRIILFTIFLYSYFFYSTDFTVSLKVTIILVIIIVFINSPKHVNSLNILLNKNQLEK